MSVSGQWKSSFSSAVKQRGESYSRSRRVELLEAGYDSASAEVEGSGRMFYDVDIYRDESGCLVGSCSCPHYEDGNLCKHLWATLLELQKKGYIQKASEISKELYHEDDLMEEDDFDLDEIMPLKRNNDSSSNGPASPKTPKRKHNSKKRKNSTPAWQEQLNHVSSQLSDYCYIDLAKAQKQREIYYLLDVERSAREGRLSIHFIQRERKQNGEFGALKKLSVARDDIRAFANPENRSLMDLMIGSQKSEPSNYSRYDYYGPSKHERVLLAPAMANFLLPRLCATGRFSWVPNESTPKEDATLISWDEGLKSQPAWQFRINCEADDTKKCWRLSGELRRGRRRRPLHDAALLMPKSFVLFENQMARFEISDENIPWGPMLMEGPMEVPYKDRKKLLSAMYELPMLPKMDLPDELQVEQLQVEPQGRLKIQTPKKNSYRSHDKLDVNVSFTYGEVSFDLQSENAAHFSEKQNRVILRDRRRESQMAKELMQLGLHPASAQERSYAYHYSGPTFDLLMPKKRMPEIVWQLIQDGWIVESDGVKIRQPGQFSMSVASGVDWFELSGEIDFGGVSLTLPELLKAAKTQGQLIRLGDGSQGMLPEKWLQKYGQLIEMGQNDGKSDSIRFAPSQALLLDAMLVEQDYSSTDRQFNAFRKKLKNFSGIKPSKQPRGFQGKMRNYQKEGLGWLQFLRDFRLGGCLADDMGLGKTIQVLALLQSRRLQRPKNGQQRKPSLVVVPKSLVFNWIDEAKRFTPNLCVQNYTGLDRKARLKASNGYDLLITTYGTLRRDIHILRQKDFDYAILDESQAIKNHTSQAAKATRLLQADHRLAMTGTPIENNLSELWSLFEFLNPGMLGSSSKFAKLAKNGSNDLNLENGSTGNNGSLVTLAEGLRPFLLRRTKEQVLTELPKKTEQTLYCKMNGTQRKAYNKLRDYYRAQLTGRVKEHGIQKSKIHVLEALLRLRQMACHPGLLDASKEKLLSPKLETLLEQLQEVVTEGHKTLIFSQFTSLLHIVQRHFDQVGITYEYLDGRTRKRADKVKRFQTDPQCSAFLISLKAGGHGLNLTAADYVFILDPWWNPAVESQAIDRAHRMGQTRPVFAYRLICADTVEDKILELQQSKRELADAIISADQSFIRNLTAEDLQLLLSQ